LAANDHLPPQLCPIAGTPTLDQFPPVFQKALSNYAAYFQMVVDENQNLENEVQALAGKYQLTIQLLTFFMILILLN
jgi:hypothetical protein